MLYVLDRAPALISYKDFGVLTYYIDYNCTIKVSKFAASVYFYTFVTFYNINCICQ